jgi:hypothetical protein
LSDQTRLGDVLGSGPTFELGPGALAAGFAPLGGDLVG